MAGWIGPAIQGVTGIIQAIGGKSREKKAKHRYESMEELDYTQSLAYQNAQLSENILKRGAQEGLPQESLDYYNEQVTQTTAAGLNSISSLRSGISGVSSLATSVLSSNRAIAVTDANMRIENKNRWMASRDKLIEQGETAFDYEMGYDMLERARYLSEMAAGREQMNQGLQNVSDAGGNAGSIGGGK